MKIKDKRPVLAIAKDAKKKPCKRVLDRESFFNVEFCAPMSAAITEGALRRAYHITYGASLLALGIYVGKPKKERLLSVCPWCGGDVLFWANKGKPPQKMTDNAG